MALSAFRKIIIRIIDPCVGDSSSKGHQITKGQKFNSQSLFSQGLNTFARTGFLIENDLEQCPFSEKIVGIGKIKRHL